MQNWNVVIAFIAILSINYYVVKMCIRVNIKVHNNIVIILETIVNNYDDFLNIALVSLVATFPNSHVI